MDISKPIKTLVILMAMQREADPVIAALNMVACKEKIHQQLPMHCYFAKRGSLNVYLMVSGKDPLHDVDNIGSEAATLMAYESIIQFKPDLMISAGTAGGFSSKGANVGTVYLSDSHFIYHDRHVPIDGFKESAIGKYPGADFKFLAKELDLPQGVISTGSSLEKLAKDLEIIEEHQAVAKEMEAAAIAWVCMLFNIPVLALKSITNLLDEDNQSEEEFIKNLEHASAQLKIKLCKLVDLLIDKRLDDLK